MDAAKRWETEAMRESRDRKRGRPAVSQDRDSAPRSGEWRTLREASELTGIPIGTLRKWCRRDTVDTYLESDGELTLRMVEMGSVRAKRDTSRREPDASREHRDTRHDTRDTRHETPARPPEPATMIVPVDAWNKMLNQLGNLHEAGQQLAEARERAAKAETEALFLRERLAELREASSYQPPAASHDGGGGHTPIAPAASPETAASADGGGQASSEPIPDSGTAADGEGQTPPVPVTETSSFWRYVVRGWRGRRR
ncbi:MAG: hypothetical protein WBN35_01530 [Acidimicrobiia bacterium]